MSQRSPSASIASSSGLERWLAKLASAFTRGAWRVAFCGDGDGDNCAMRGEEGGRPICGELGGAGGKRETAVCGRLWPQCRRCSMSIRGSACKGEGGGTHHCVAVAVPRALLARAGRSSTEVTTMCDRPLTCRGRTVACCSLASLHGSLRCATLARVVRACACWSLSLLLLDERYKLMLARGRAEVVRCAFVSGPAHILYAAAWFLLVHGRASPRRCRRGGAFYFVLPKIRLAKSAAKSRAWRRTMICGGAS